MAPHVKVDTQWAESLVGLRVNVPDKWWAGYYSDSLNPGVIKSVDFRQPRQKYFQLELDHVKNKLVLLR